MLSIAIVLRANAMHCDAREQKPEISCIINSMKHCKTLQWKSRIMRDLFNYSNCYVCCSLSFKREETQERVTGRWFNEISRNEDAIPEKLPFLWTSSDTFCLQTILQIKSIYITVGNENSQKHFILLIFHIEFLQHWKEIQCSSQDFRTNGRMWFCAIYFTHRLRR